MILLSWGLSSNNLASDIISGNRENLWDRDTVVADTIVADTVEKKPLFEDVIKYSANDSTHFSIEEQKVYLHGNAVVSYITTEVKADYIELDMANKLAFARGVVDTLGKSSGDPHFKDGAQEFDSKELSYNFDTKKAYVKNIIMKEGEGFMQSELTKKQTDSIFCVKHGFYTTCDEHDHPHFRIVMNKAKMIKNKKIFLAGAYLQIGEVPIFPVYLPFFFFPITNKEQSGLIMPSYGEERIRGFNLRNGGWYFYINDYIDMAVTGDIYTNGSWALRTESKYVKRYKFNGSFNISTSKNFEGERGLPDYVKSSDWSIRWTHTQDSKANPYMTFSASVDISSSTNNRYNYNSLEDIANQRKSSSITWSKKWPGNSPFSMNASISHNQNSKDKTISLTLPNFSIRVAPQYPFRKKGRTPDKWYDDISIDYKGSLTNNYSGYDSLVMKSSFAKDWKNNYNHSINPTFSFKIAKDVTFSPSISYQGWINLKSIEKIWVPTPTGGEVVKKIKEGFNYSHQYTASVSLGYTPTMYITYQYLPECKVYAIRHMIRPSISISYTPKNKPLGNYSRTFFNRGKEEEYSIYEGLTGARYTTTDASGNINFSIDNNVEMKVRNDRDTTGNEDFRKVKLLESLSLSASYNMMAKTKKLSNISISARTKVLKDKLNINFSGTLDPYKVIDNVSSNKLGALSLRNATLTSGYSFSSQEKNKTEEEKTPDKGLFDQYSEFDFNWQLSFNYSLNYSKPIVGKTTVRQMLSFNGNMKLTDKWNIGFSSGYDISNKEVTSTQFNISRDLHCWEMTFNCIPFGNHQSFNFQINVRSSTLQDLKYKKSESWYDKF